MSVLFCNRCSYIHFPESVIPYCGKYCGDLYHVPDDEFLRCDKCLFAEADGKNFKKGEQMSSVEKPGSTYKLFSETCRKCFYNTRSNQCAWFEYPHIAQEILEAKKNVKPGILACPYYKKKATFNSGFLFGRRRKGYEPEDEIENIDDLEDLV